MADTLRWGILGTGNIARQFCAGVRTSSRRSALAAVGSRTLDAARSFADAYGIPAALGSYDEVLRREEVDAVYVSLPNSMHLEWTLRALEAGKHVLCEKPLAASAAEAEAMFAAAGRAGRVLVEAFMYRAHPLTRAVLEVVRGGAIGEVKLVRTSFCYRTTRIAGNIRFDAALAGGALMDIGCYCTDFARLVAGEAPAEARAAGRLHPTTGVDEMAAGFLRFPSGIVSSFTCGMGVQADNAAYVCGSEGYVEVPVPWKPPMAGAVYTIARGTPPKMDGGPKPGGPPPRETRTVDAGQDLYGIEADAFAAAAAGEAEPFMTAEESIGNMRLLDELRRQVGARVPEGGAR